MVCAALMLHKLRGDVKMKIPGPWENFWYFSVPFLPTDFFFSPEEEAIEWELSIKSPSPLSSEFRMVFKVCTKYLGVACALWCQLVVGGSGVSSTCDISAEPITHQEDVSKSPLPF